ncbi:MAG: HU family DNA-binding protein [Proteobacteria bacterium]|nr:HU family DNA-binding protein [Pseudomonadota bacterium]MBU1058527.1 HU family DNA-binding protein [Pseudomonadota bacterium]
MSTARIRPCPGCSGSGQTSTFGGVSRFLLSYEECPECNGVGFLTQEDDHSVPVEYIAGHSGLSASEANRFLQELAQTLTTILIQGQTVHLRGFGSFSLSSAGSGKRHINFSPGTSLQKYLNHPQQ